MLVTDHRTGKYPTTFTGDNLYFIKCRSMNGGIFKKIVALFKNTIGYLQARNIIKELKPIAVVGFGGYPSFPTMVAAVHLKQKTILHEQNSVLGRVNKLTASKVGIIATAFTEVHHIKDKDRPKVHFVGNPIRKEIASLASFTYPDLSDDGHYHILVTGGSQGAKIFGEVVPKAIALLPENMRKRLRIDQQCREAELDEAKKTYEEAGVDADLAPFFKDMASRLASAHLVIARSGAGTVTELAIAGKPSILIPLPYAMDNHQYFNAAFLSENGAAIRMPQKDFTAEQLAKVIETLLSNHNSLLKMSEKARSQSKADAVEALTELVIEKQHNIKEK